MSNTFNGVYVDGKTGTITTNETGFDYTKGRDHVRILYEDVLRVDVLNEENVKLTSINQSKKNLNLKTSSLKLKSPDEDFKRWLTNINSNVQESIVNKRPRSILSFINPSSGNGHGVNIYNKTAKPLFDLCNIKQDIIVTEDFNTIGKVLKDYDLTKIDSITVTGGDGSLTQYVDGLYKLRSHLPSDSFQSALKIPVGIIPAGSGQGHAYSYYKSVDVTTAVLNIIKGKTTSRPLFEANLDNEPSFGCLMLCSGVAGDLAKETEARRSMGKIRYLYSLPYMFIKHRLHKMNIEYKASENSEWSSFEGSFLDVFIFYLTLDENNEVHASKQESSGLITILCITSCTGFQHLNFFISLRRNVTNALQRPFVKTVRACEARIRYMEDPGEDGLYSFNLDGEYRSARSPTVHLISNRQSFVAYHNPKSHGTWLRS